MEKSKMSWTVLSMLEWATGYFESRNIPNPRLSIEWLLAEVLSIHRLDLYLQYDRPLSPHELDELRSMVRRRGSHEPLQYIVGSTEFMNCTIQVKPGVLIPRVETEQLVEQILHSTRNRSDNNLQILDIGTGSGCIPVSLAKAVPEWKITGIDISPDALKQAEENALLNEVTVEFIEADITHPDTHSLLAGREFDLIISNPPYILPEEMPEMDRQVLDFEPHPALFHENPLQLYGAIGEFSGRHLTPSGTLWLECNHKLTKEIVRLLEKSYKTVEILKDYDERDRFIRAEKCSK